MTGGMTQKRDWSAELRGLADDLEVEGADKRAVAKRLAEIVSGLDGRLSWSEIGEKLG